MQASQARDKDAVGGQSQLRLPRGHRSGEPSGPRTARCYVNEHDAGRVLGLRATQQAPDRRVVEIDALGDPRVDGTGGDDDQESVGYRLDRKSVV